MSQKKTILLLDLWTDANRGDCALQSGLVSMVRDRWPSAKIVGIFRFGSNEIASAMPEVASTVASLDEICGGLRRTYYSAENFNRFGTIAAKLLSLLSFIEVLAFVLAYSLKFRFLLPATKRKVLDLISTADIVIWKGKNFRDYGGLGGINRQLTLLSAGMIATLFSRNVHCVNASVWPMRNRVERYLVRFAFSRCRSISVREPASLSALKQIGIEDVRHHFAQDLSFYCLRRTFNATGRRRENIDSLYDVSLTITQWGGSKAQRVYVDSLRRCLVRLVEAGARRFAIVPQVTRVAEDNSALTAAVRELLPDGSGISIDIVEGSPDISDLLDIYERSSLLIGTRMHSCVFAMSVGTPFVAIAYDAGPKWDILKEFWPSRFIFEYESNGDVVAAAAVELFKNSSAIVSEASERFEPLALASFNNVKFI